jgi:hypothetical protein
MATPQELIEEAHKLLALAEQIQDEAQSEQERKVKLDEVSSRYRAWYRKALGLIANANQPELQQSFRKEYEGGVFSQKVEKFLSLGWQIYSLYDPDKPNPIIPKWTTPFETALKQPLNRQCDVLATIGDVSSAPTTAQRDRTWSQTFRPVMEELQISSIEDEFKNIILYDLEQARLAYKAGALKACIVMLGAALEGIMLGTLRRPEVLDRLRIDLTPPGAFKKLGFTRYTNAELADKIADDLGFEDYKNITHYLIPEIEKLKVEGIQIFRNAVHPWKTVKEPNIYAKPDQTRTINHITSLAILARRILTWMP